MYGVTINILGKRKNIYTQLRRQGWREGPSVSGHTSSSPRADIFTPSSEIGTFSSEYGRGTDRLSVGTDSQSLFWELPST